MYNQQSTRKMGLLPVSLSQTDNENSPGKGQLHLHKEPTKKASILLELPTESLDDSLLCLAQWMK